MLTHTNRTADVQGSLYWNTPEVLLTHLLGESPDGPRFQASHPLDSSTPLGTPATCLAGLRLPGQNVRMPRAGQTQEQEGCVPSNTSVLTTLGRLQKGAWSGCQAQRAEEADRDNNMFYSSAKTIWRVSCGHPWLVRVWRNFHFQLPRLQLRMTRSRWGCVRVVLPMPSPSPTISRGAQHQHPLEPGAMHETLPMHSLWSSSPMPSSHPLPPLSWAIQQRPTLKKGEWPKKITVSRLII